MNLLGQEFNELKVIEKTDKRSKYGGSIIWKCLCKCGKKCEASTSNLRSGHKKSCGHLHGWSTEEKTKQTQEHDRIKNDYCKQNNIPIIRIPYTKLHNIQIEDLLLDTSNYII